MYKFRKADGLFVWLWSPKNLFGPYRSSHCIFVISHRYALLFELLFTSRTQSTSPWNCVPRNSRWILKYSSRLAHSSSDKLKWKAAEFSSNALKYLVHQNMPKKDYKSTNVFFIHSRFTFILQRQILQTSEKPCIHYSVPPALPSALIYRPEWATYQNQYCAKPV